MPTIYGKFVGEKVLEEGYLVASSLNVYADPATQYPLCSFAKLTLITMLESISYVIDGKLLSLGEIIRELEDGESISWLVYLKFVHPSNDKLKAFEFLIPPDMSGFLELKLNREISEKYPLETGQSFKILFKLTNNDNYRAFVEKILNKVPVCIGFGGSGKGERRSCK